MSVSIFHRQEEMSVTLADPFSNMKSFKFHRKFTYSTLKLNVPIASGNHPKIITMKHPHEI